jgi:hypothetical protein
MNDMRTIFRATIPVNDEWAVLELTGPIIHVATRGEDYIEIWFIHDPNTEPATRAFRVVGTGHPMAPALAHHVGTAITPSGEFVWHLMEHERPQAVAR